MHRNWKLMLIHLVGALGFLAIPILISPDFFLGRAFWLSRGFRVEMAIYVLMLGFFYLHYYVLVPRLYYRKRWWQYILALVAVLVLTVALPLLLVGEFGHPTDHPRHFSPSVEGQPPHLGPPIRFFIARTMAVVTGLFLVVVFFSLLLRASRRLKEMEEEKMHAQLAYLKAQINPHFLFNTLNSIYAMAIEKSDATADAVVKLSGMMRFVITEGDRDHVPLEKELGYVRDYIDLQRLRLGDTATIDFEVKGQSDNLQIAPLIIIAFIENAFKHGLNPEENARLHIHIGIEDQQLHLHVANQKLRKAKDAFTETGIGLENASRRLNLLYPGRHTLRIEENEKEFRVWLSIRL